LSLKTTSLLAKRVFFPKET